MSVEAFLKLKEIDSLSRMKQNFERAKSEQEDRVSKLNIRRQEALLQTAKLKQDLISVYNDTADMEKKLKVASEQKSRLIDLGGSDEKINKFSEEISVLENEGFLLLEKAEEIETHLSENKEFLAGLEKTITEIEVESRQEISLHDKEIASLNTRLSLLLENLPGDFKAIYEKVNNKKLAHGPFTRVEQGSCYFCRYKLSRIEESEIDMQKGLKTCNQCGRIFLPYGA